MESNEKFAIKIKSGKCFRFEFSAIVIEIENGMGFHFSRYDENGGLNAKHGALYVNYDTNRVGVSYDCFTLIGNITKVEKVEDDGFRLCCVSDNIEWEIEVRAI